MSFDNIDDECVDVNQLDIEGKTALYIGEYIRLHICLLSPF